MMIRNGVLYGNISTLKKSLADFLSSPHVLSPSAIWGVVQGTKNILGKGCSWKIGNGQKVRFWEDDWLMDHPLIEDFEDTTQVDKCKQMYGTLVGHYWHNNTWVNLIDVDQVFYNILISSVILMLFLI